MVAHRPIFCDITWGAGGSTATATLDIAEKMQHLVGGTLRAGVVSCGVARLPPLDPARPRSTPLAAAAANPHICDPTRACR